jgi:hypothetical protein
LWVARFFHHAIGFVAERKRPLFAHRPHLPLPLLFAANRHFTQAAPEEDDATLWKRFILKLSANVHTIILPAVFVSLIIYM